MRPVSPDRAWCVTATITVSHSDPRIADGWLKAVEKIVQGRDFTCIPRGLNALEAWLGSLPGHAYANVCQPPISTLNLAHMIPLSAVWAEPEANEHLGGPPLFFAHTEGSTPFRFSSHVGDVGHTLVVGPTGDGKSVLLTFMALQFRRYAGAQVFAFDFGGSIRAAMLAVGGDWHDLGGGLASSDGVAKDAPSLQPLARIDDAGERAWAAEWLAGVLTREGVAVAGRQEAAVAKRLDLIVRVLERLERNDGIALETLAMFIRAWLTANPPTTDQGSAAARAKGAERYDRFVEAFGRRLSTVGSLGCEVTMDTGQGRKADKQQINGLAREAEAALSAMATVTPLQSSAPARRPTRTGRRHECGCR